MWRSGRGCVCVLGEWLSIARLSSARGFGNGDNNNNNPFLPDGWGSMQRTGSRRQDKSGLDWLRKDSKGRSRQGGEGADFCPPSSVGYSQAAAKSTTTTTTTTAGRAAGGPHKIQTPRADGPSTPPSPVFGKTTFAFKRAAWGGGNDQSPC
jgi:hypothetical protein